MRLMVLGDVHGNAREAARVIQHANDLGLDRIIWVGDCGLWPGQKGMNFLDEVQRFSHESQVKNYWIGGNHEWWDEWIRVVTDGPKDTDGFAYLRSNIVLSPRIKRWRWLGKQFMAAAGAVSIDRQWRIEGESWWPQEQLSEGEVYGVEQMGKHLGGTDFLFTHDCSNYTPFRGRLKPDPDSMEHRRKMDRIIAAVRPDMHFHGHMHTRYEWDNTMSNPNHLTRTFGLECDGDRDNYGVLDTDTGSFVFASDLV